MNPSKNKINIDNLDNNEIENLFNVDNQNLKEELLKELNIEENSEINLITEGKAKIFVKTYKTNNKNELEEQEVFYNPVQVSKNFYITHINIFFFLPL